MKDADTKASRPYLRTRDAEIERLFIECGLEPREIAVRMIKDGTIQSDSLDSAVRTVRGVVAKIRQRIDAARVCDADVKIAGNEADALERKLVWLRAERDRQQMIADGEPIEMCARSSYPIEACPNRDCAQIGSHVPYVGPAIGITIVNTPQGPMTSYKALWPAGVRQKASKDLIGITIKIAELEAILIARRDDVVGASEHGGGDRLHLIESDKSIPELIEANLIVGRFGSKKDGGHGSTGGTATG